MATRPVTSVYTPHPALLQLDPSHAIRCNALVDTGAAYLTLPNAWRDRLGPLTELDTVDVETANQSVIQGLICGPVLLRMPVSVRC